MVQKAWMADENDTPHLLIGLSKQALESIQRGEVVTLPRGQNIPLTNDSDIVLMYEDTEEALIERMNGGFGRAEAKENRAQHRHRKPSL